MKKINTFKSQSKVKRKFEIPFYRSKIQIAIQPQTLYNMIAHIFIINNKKKLNSNFLETEFLIFLKKV